MAPFSFGQMGQRMTGMSTKCGQKWDIHIYGN